MPDKKQPIKENLNIGKNTNWDSPIEKSQNGATIQKPSIGLKPKEKGGK